MRPSKFLTETLDVFLEGVVASYCQSRRYGKRGGKPRAAVFFKILRTSSPLAHAIEEGVREPISRGALPSQSRWLGDALESVRTVRMTGQPPHRTPNKMQKLTYTRTRGGASTDEKFLDCFAIDPGAV